MIKIDLEMTVQELLAHHPCATTAFIKHRMLCVGCPAQAFHTLEDVVRIHGCTLDGLRNAIRDAIDLNLNINELPISFDIAWYEQKAVAVLLALLSLGVKGIRLGPTLPGFLSPTVVGVLVEKFGIQPIGAVQEDIAAMMAGK